MKSVELLRVFGINGSQLLLKYILAYVEKHILIFLTAQKKHTGLRHTVNNVYKNSSYICEK